MHCRSWLAVELLCFCEETGLQQEAVALCSFLAGVELSDASTAVSSNLLVEATLKRCAQGCCWHARLASKTLFAWTHHFHKYCPAHL